MYFTRTEFRAEISTQLYTNNRQNSILKKRKQPIYHFNKITILIRNTYHPTIFSKCIQSILMQEYTNYRIIMCYDDDRCMEYLDAYKNHNKIELFKVKRENEGLYFYNLYYNHLLDRVRDGWIIFLNNDNMFAQHDALKKINSIIKTENDIIFWKVKLGEHIISPNIYNIKYGQIDIAGLCFHSKYKNAARWIAEQGSDFHYISHLLKKHYLIRRALPEILIQTIKTDHFGQKNNNKMYNLIGFKYLKCSISDNLFVLKNYLTEQFKNCIVNIIDIDEFNNQNNITLCNNHETIICLQPIECYNIRTIINKLIRKPSVLWIWEFKSLPSIFKVMEKYFSKIYVQSNFCYEIFLKYFTIPIEYIKMKSLIHNYIDKINNHTIKNQKIINILDNTINQTRIGFCFDINSSIIRKNPINLVNAFNSLNDKTIALILKYRLPINGQFLNTIEKNLFYEFIRLTKFNDNIYLIDDELDILDLYKLYTYFDYYISPHIAEGFGITIYDNMILGNKIISPYYSGEKDYLKPGKFIELKHKEKIIPSLKEHPIYGQMSEYKAAYVSIEEIHSVLQNIHQLDILLIYYNYYNEVRHEKIENFYNTIIKKNNNLLEISLLIKNLFVNNTKVIFNGVHDIDKYKGYSLAIVNYNFIKILKQYFYCDIIDDNKEKSKKGIKLFMSYPLIFDESYKIVVNWGWEESKIPEKIINRFQKLDFITVMSNYVKNTLIDNGLKIPIFVTNLGVDHITNNTSSINIFKKFTSKKHKFLHISSCFDRKAIYEILEAYFIGFTNNDDVCLIIKTFENIHNNKLNNHINKYKKKFINYPEIIVNYNYYKINTIISLIKYSSCIIIPSKSEGFGLPIGEAMLLKKPVIVTNCTGQKDFCNKNNSFIVDYEFEFSKSHFSNELNKSITPIPIIQSIILNMKQFINCSKNELNLKINNAYKNIIKFTWENNFKEFMISNLKYNLSFKIRVLKPKIGIISNLEDICGIGIYNKNLFFEDKSLLFLTTYNSDISGQNIIKCFDNPITNKHTLKIYLQCNKLDIIIIHYHSSYFSKDILGSIINYLKRNGKIIIIIIHNCYINNLFPNNMNLVDRIIVHTLFDMNFFKFNYNIYNCILIPLANNEPINVIKLRKKITTIGTFGYCRYHKGIIELIKAFIKLNNNSLKLKLYTNIDHIHIDTNYYKSIIKLVENNKNINIDINYYPLAELVQKLEQIDLYVFPTKECNESSSASLRTVMESLKPILISNSHIYNEFNDIDYIFKLKDNSIDTISNSINNIIKLKYETIYKKMELQKKYLEINTFKKTRELILNICHSLFINKNT